MTVKVSTVSRLIPSSVFRVVSSMSTLLALEISCGKVTEMKLGTIFQTREDTEVRLVKDR